MTAPTIGSLAYIETNLSIDPILCRWEAGRWLVMDTHGPHGGFLPSEVTKASPVGIAQPPEKGASLGVWIGAIFLGVILAALVCVPVILIVLAALAHPASGIAFWAASGISVALGYAVGRARRD